MAELQKKEEEMRQMFVVRVKEKETELKDAEKDVCLYLCHFRIMPQFITLGLGFKIYKKFKKIYVC